MRREFSSKYALVRVVEIMHKHDGRTARTVKLRHPGGGLAAQFRASFSGTRLHTESRRNARNENLDRLAVGLVLGEHANIIHPLRPQRRTRRACPHYLGKS